MEAPTRRRPIDARLSDFALLWAVGTLVHLGHTGRFGGPWLLETAAACFVALHPRSRHGLLVLAAIQLSLVAMTYPWVANHTVLVAFVDVVILIELLDRRRTSADRWVVHLRMLLVVTYAWAGFHKLNEGFLDPATSCAVDHAERLARVFGGDGVPAGASMLVVVATLLIEIGVPVALLVRGARPWGVVVALAFHFLLGWNGFEDFSAIAAALLVVSLGLPLGGGIVDRLARAFATRPMPVIARIGIVVALVVLLHALPQPRALAFPIWVLYAGALLVVSVRHALGSASRTSAPPGTRMSAAGRLLGAAFLLNGASPYVGLKTDVSLAMFSNLRTEGPYWNHLLAPRVLRVFHQQDDLVMVLGAAPHEVAGQFDAPRWMPQLELRMRVEHARAQTSAPLVLVVASSDALRLVPDAAADPELGRPVPAWIAKLTRFREIPPRVEACTH